MPTLQQSRPNLPEQATTQAPAEAAVRDAASDIREAALKRSVEVPDGREAALPGAAAESADVQLAREVVKNLDDGSFKGIASVERVAALELAKRKTQEADSNRMQRQSATFPKSAVEGYSPSELLQQLLGEVLFASRTRMLGQRRCVTFRGAKDSISWLQKGLQALSELTTGILSAPVEKSSRHESGLEDDHRADVYSPSGTSLERLLAQAEREVLTDLATATQKTQGLRLIKDDEE